MATELYMLSAEDRKILDRVLERERKNRRQVTESSLPEGDGSTVNAITKTGEAILPDEIGTVILCGLDWVSLGIEVEAHNPSQVEIADTAIRLILAPGKGKDYTYQIQQAFLCAE
jgi:hypothetical protein